MSDNELANPQGEIIEAPSAEAEPKRRVRRSRTVAAPDPEPAAEPTADAAADANEAPAARETRPERPKRPRRPRKNKGADAGGAVLQSPQRKIYRQDVPGDFGAPEPPAARPDAAPKKADINEKDKITLILHPAPKPGAHRGAAKKKDRPKTAKEALQAKTKGAPKRDDKKDAPKKDVALDPAWLKADEQSAADILRSAGDAGEALVKAWLDAGNVGAIARAAQLDDLAGGPRKAARRALNVFRSRGVAIPKLSEPAKPAVSAPEPPVAKFIPPDASGTSFVSISQRQAGGRYFVADVLYRTGVGVVHATAARLAGHHIRDWESRIEKQFGAKPVTVSLAWARHQVAEARKQNDVSKAILPLGFDSCAPLLTPLPDAAPPHPLADLEQDWDDGAVDKAKLGSEALHNEPEFRTWMPDRGAVDELLRKVGERLGDEGAAEDSSKVDEALRAEVAAATDRFFSPELRQELSERMRDAAISVRARGGDEAARKVLAVARAVRDAGLITSPPSEVPFLLTFFQKAIAIMVRQGQGQLRVPVPQRQSELGT